MNWLRTTTIGAGLVAALAVTGIVVPQQTGMTSGGIPGTVIQDPNLIVPRTRIIEFDEGVARFDTTTGSIDRFSGTLLGPNASGTWLRYARPVTSTSGFLELQQIGDATFLVDSVTGNTWLLRRRSTLAAWIPVNVLGG